MMLVATLAGRLGLEALAADLVPGSSTQQPPRAPGAQQAAVIDAVGPEDHRVEDRHDLAAHLRGARAVTAQPHAIDARDVSARVYLRACPPARRAARPGA